MRSALILIFSLLFVPLVYGQTNQSESLTITTYYPSPYGVYRNLEIHRSVKYHPLGDLSAATIPNPTAGQLAYLHNAANEGFYYYNSGGAWQAQSGGGGGVCYTNYGQNTCASGYTAVLTG